MTLHSVIIQLLLRQNIPTCLYRQYSSHETRLEGYRTSHEKETIVLIVRCQSPNCRRGLVDEHEGSYRRRLDLRKE